jgi:hypothetical protein
MEGHTHIILNAILAHFLIVNVVLVHYKFHLYIQRENDHNSCIFCDSTSFKLITNKISRYFSEVFFLVFVFSCYFVTCQKLRIFDHVANLKIAEILTTAVGNMNAKVNKHVELTVGKVSLNVAKLITSSPFIM